jgi:uncharacterized phage-associated protein
MEEKKAYSAVDIAKYLISKAKEEADGETHVISPLKLQKILYYTQGWYLGMYGEPLFSENIYAWKYGPVVQEIYQKYKSFGSENLAINPTVDLSFIIGDGSIKNHLDKVWNTYKSDTAEKLVTRTHNSEPWLEAFKNPFNDVIEKDVMTRHFLKLLKK